MSCHCAECGALAAPNEYGWLLCSADDSHDAISGGFHCPGCGSPTKGRDREGSLCPSCEAINLIDREEL